MSVKSREEREREVREQYDEITDKLFSDRQSGANFAALAETLNIPAEHRRGFYNSARTMVRAVVAARCCYLSKFNYKSADALDLSAVDMLKNKAELEKLLEYVQKNAKAVLLSIEKDITEIQRRAIYERGNQADLVRGGQDVLPRNQGGERQEVSARPADVRVPGGAVARSDGRGAGADEQADRLLRQEVAGVYGGELSSGHSGAERQNVVGADTEADRQGSRGNGVEFGAGIREEQSPTAHVSRNSAVGEDEVARSQSQSDEGNRPQTARINNSAEADKAPADFVSEKSFVEQVDEVLNGTASRYNDLKVCDTPQILLDVGCEQLPMLYTQKHLRNAIKEKSRSKHTHGLSIEQIKAIPEMLNNPVMIYDSLSRNDSLVVVTSEFDVDNCPIVVSVKPNGQGKYEIEDINSNFITSIYGREGFANHFIDVINQDKLLYLDKTRSQEMFRVLRLEFPQGVNTLDFNIIIHQSRNIVKGSEEKISEDRQDFEQITLDSEPERATYSTNPTAAEPVKKPTITCEWSESSVFEDGKTYSVLEFDELMKRADREWVEKKQYEKEKYGDFDTAYEAYQRGEIDGIHLGYAKTKFTVNLPNGSTITERQDIGDGYGGVIDFLSRYKQYWEVADMLKKAADEEREEIDLANSLNNDFNPYVYDGSMSLDDSLLVADAHNLDELMQGYSDELKNAAGAYNNFEKFRRYSSGQRRPRL